ncbi:MAG: carboxypeptidase regulatory-like domain-containing protein [Acidobacteria bacterium]|nr:MAG: carboxypeptidase regulatory-like domain-containing protein [Acidobacteriota bacterium]
MPPLKLISSIAGTLALAMLIVSMTPAAAGAQATTGEITGRVLDNTGLVLPGATITLENPATGLTRTTTTNGTGDYSFVLLPPGIYTVTVEMAGFQRMIRKDVTVRVGTRQTLVFEMELGGLTEEVEVVGETPLIETTRSDIGGVVTPAEITNLPLLNRTFANLSVIMPEARPASAVHRCCSTWNSWIDS